MQACWTEKSLHAHNRLHVQVDPSTLGCLTGLTMIVSSGRKPLANRLASSLVQDVVRYMRARYPDTPEKSGPMIVLLRLGRNGLATLKPNSIA